MDITVWHLSSCSTCQRILKELGLDSSRAEMIDIKKNPVTSSQIDQMYETTGSYRSLINGRSTQFRTMGKKAKDLGEEEARELLLKHYAFLKRPVIKIGLDYYVGNSKKVVQEAKNRIQNG